MNKRLLAIGFGYVATTLTRTLGPEWRVAGTTRGDPAKIVAAGAEPIRWPGNDLRPALERATHIVSSVPPTADGDPVLEVLARDLSLDWLALLSTTGVFGDAGGDWVEEDTPQVPAGHRGARRAAQEAAWLALHPPLPVHVFRLAGIYGPGRSALDKVRDGTARRIVKPGQVFSRIHVEDIVQVLMASIARPNPGRTYNVADDMPAPPQDVIEEAAVLLGQPIPPDLPFESAEMTPMARSFYADNKRISNRRIKEELGVELRYPDYKVGLRALLEGR